MHVDIIPYISTCIPGRWLIHPFLARPCRSIDTKKCKQGSMGPGGTGATGGKRQKHEEAWGEAQKVHDSGLVYEL